MNILDIKQNTPEWHALRRTKIGASDAAVIMGVSPWKNTLQLYWEKKGAKSNNYTSPAMQRGLDLEPHARNKFENMFDVMMFPQVVQHHKYDWMIASLDGLSFDKDTFVEIKCPNRHDHSLAELEIIPEHYIPQLQHQLACTNLEFGYYFSFDGLKGIPIKVYRDEEYIKKLIEKELQFYELLMSGIPPEDETIKKYKKNESDEWIYKTEAYKNLENVIKKMELEKEALEKQKKEIKEQLVSLSGKSNTMGNGIRLSKIIRKGPIDHEKLYKEERVNLEKYRKQPIEYWNIHITDE